jgi:thioredoxin-like negative regulator of GroEL
MRKVEALKFWAPWCSPCKALSTILEGVEINNYNIDEEESAELAKQFSIRSIPTIIFAVDGIEVRRIAGIITKKEYLETLEELQNGTGNTTT